MSHTVPLNTLPNEKKHRRVRVFDEFIELTNSQWSIVDTPHFASLKHVAQLGASRWVYPSAVNSRWEHMVYTSHLAKWMMLSLQKEQPELKITDEQVEMVSTAALCHDLGHCTMSHCFDFYLIPLLKNVPEELKEHESRGIVLFKWMCEHYQLGFNSKQIELIQHLILGVPLDEHPKWIFEIVNNHRNTLDVDKMAYLIGDMRSVGRPCHLQIKPILESARVIADEICYPRKFALRIQDIFISRKTMFTEVYRHPKLGEVEAIVICMFEHMAKAFDWASLFHKPEENEHAWRLVLTDATFYSLPSELRTPSKWNKYTEEQKFHLKEAYTFFQCLERRQWFQLIQEPHLVVAENSPAPSLPPAMSRHLSQENVFTFEYVIGYSNNPNKNPMKTVTLFSLSSDQNSFVLECLQDVLKQERGENPCYERHSMAISKPSFAK